MQRLKMKKYYFFFLSLTILIFFAYSNSLHSGWHFDDYSNITNNARININDLSFNSLKESMHSWPGKPDKLYRPVSCLTFALNSFFSGNDTYYFHITNILLHIAVSISLFILLSLIFKTPTMKNFKKDEADFIILFTTAFWALNPIQTQAVTYIVQRMTILSALFSILSLMFYIKARLSVRLKHRVLKFLLAFGFCILSVLSKENGFITIFSFLLIEIVFFGAIKNITTKRIIKLILFVSLIIVLLYYILSIFGFNSNSLLNYSSRPFTLTQRILTQPRVLLFYISLIFYPTPDRFSIEHEIIYSNGLLTPPETLISISGIILLIMYSFRYKKKYPLISMAILFFLLNHSVESTILPLEMIFEHRNYLPSIFIFAPIGQLLYCIINKYKTTNRLLYFTLNIFIILCFFFLALGTYLRNFDWLTEKTLWKNAAIHAPSSPRVWNNLGLIAKKENNSSQALEYYHKALTLEKNIQLKQNISLINSNIADLVYSWKKDWKTSINYINTAIDLNPKNAKAHKLKAAIYLSNNDWLKAIDTLEAMLKIAPNYTDAYTLLGVCYLNLNKYNMALKYFKMHLDASPNNFFTIINIGESLSLLKYKDKADLYFRIAASLNQHSSIPYICMSKNQYFNGDTNKSAHYLHNYFKRTGAENISSSLKYLSDRSIIQLVGLEAMDSFIQKELKLYLDNIYVTSLPTGGQDK